MVLTVAGHTATLSPPELTEAASDGVDISCSEADPAPRSERPSLRRTRSRTSPVRARQSAGWNRTPRGRGARSGPDRWPKHLCRHFAWVLVALIGAIIPASALAINCGGESDIEFLPRKPATERAQPRRRTKAGPIHAPGQPTRKAGLPPRSLSPVSPKRSGHPRSRRPLRQLLYTSPAWTSRRSLPTVRA